MNKRKITVCILIVLIIIVVSALYCYYEFNEENKLTASGTVEVTKYDVTPRIAGYIRNLSYKEGDFLTEGILVCQIEREDLQRQNESAWQAVQVAQATLADMQRGAREQEIFMAKSQIDKTKAVYDKTRADLNRNEQLYAVGGISRQELDNAHEANNVAKEDYLSAQANYDLVMEGTRKDQIVAQVAEVQRLIAAAKANEDLVNNMNLYSPVNGVIISKNFENNEYINAGESVITIADLKDCWIKVYISTMDLGKVYIGQKAELMVDAFPQEKFTGKVVEISDEAEFTPRESITKEERANMVFAVKIKIENIDSKIKAGMPADVIFCD